MEFLRPEIRGIALGLWLQVALIAISICALPFDTRKVLGINPWFKPLKFELSVAILLLTCGVLSNQLARTPARDLVGWTLSVALCAETLLIAMQGARGVRSHMNFTTPFDHRISALMGLCVLGILVGLAGLLVMYLTSEVRWPPTLVLAARLGLAVLIAGSLEGFAIIARGQHTVGGPDGAGGLPFVDWSRSHGDLRVAHFFAIHALQAFLVAGFALSRTRFAIATQSIAMVGVVVAYSLLCFWLFRGALLGRALV